MNFADYVADRRGALLRFATVLTGQAWLADDIVSDVLGRAFERWDRIFQASRGDRATCDDTDRVQCDVSSPDVGGSLATGAEHLQTSATGVTYQANYVRPDGAEFVFHVSNERDPKGLSPVSAPKPPLSIAQMSQIVTSQRW